MLIAIENLRAKLVKAEGAEAKWLDKILSFKTKSYMARRFGDGRIRLLDSRSKTFPAGLVSAVRKRAKKDAMRVELIDRREVPVPADPTALIDWLRDHQLDALKSARKTHRGVFHHVTGAGKTEVMIALGELFPTRWLILVHKKDLLYEIAGRFKKRTGERVGIYGDGKMEFSQRITVAMFQSVHSGLLGQHKKAVRAFLDGVRAVAVDECHVTPAKTYWQVMMSLPNAYYRYGFSGTPFARGDQKGLYVVATLGPVIHRVSAEDLIGIGLLAKPNIRLIPVKHEPDPGQTWNEVYKNCVIQGVNRNHALVAAAQQAAKPSLLFVKSIDHGKLLEKWIRSKGISVEFVWGKHETPQRRASIRRLVHGDVDVLICNVIFQEGIDIPELQSVIIGSGGKSAIMCLQDTGRGMRRHDSTGEVTKDEFEVFDIQDLGCGCGGNKHNSCRWLDKHTKDRLRAYATEKYPVFVTSLGLEGAKRKKRTP